MIGELTAASSLLQAALERYISACDSIRSCRIQGNWLGSTLQEVSDCFSNELSKIASYETKLRHAKTAISMTRNCSSIVVPINILPDELLIRIFHQVLSSQSCTAEVGGSEDILFPRYPDLLSQVCSRWRQLAIGSSTLWSHIDLAPCHTLYQGFADRAEVCAARAGPLPLHIHVVTLKYSLGYTDSARHTLENVLKSVSTKVVSLELVAGDASELEDNTIDIRVLNGCLANCVIGTLSQLTITNNNSLSFIYPDSFDDLDIPAGLILHDPSGEFLEELWEHITTLRLYGLYPHWTSKAYHDLVELRLISNGNLSFPIPEPHLVRMLNSSPHLRIFHFDFDTTDILPADASIHRVRLEDLEVLSMWPTSAERLGSLLRWLAPGSVPLQLSISGLYQAEEFLSHIEVKDFFTRSKITKLSLVNPLVTYQQVAELIDRLPDLNFLVLNDAKCALHPNHLEVSGVYPDRQGTLAKPFRVACLYMLRCRCDLDGLQWLVGKSLVRTITLWGCTFTRGRGGLPVEVRPDFAHNLFSTSPVVKFIGGDKPNPIDGWDA